MHFTNAVFSICQSFRRRLAPILVLAWLKSGFIELHYQSTPCVSWRRYLSPSSVPHELIDEYGSPMVRVWAWKNSNSPCLYYIQVRDRHDSEKHDHERRVFRVTVGRNDQGRPNEIPKNNFLQVRSHFSSSSRGQQESVGSENNQIYWNVWNEELLAMSSVWLRSRKRFSRCPPSCSTRSSCADRCWPMASAQCGRWKISGWWREMTCDMKWLFLVKC